MTDFRYTEHVEPNSSSVDNLFYNAAERYLVIGWQGGELYRYDNVTPAEFAAVKNGKSNSWSYRLSSVGREANALKHVKGPGTYLGNIRYVGRSLVGDPAQVPVGATAPTGKVENVTTIFDNSVRTQRVDASTTVQNDGTREYALKVHPSNTKVNRKYSVVFNGGKVFNVKGATSVDDAVVEFNKAVEALGVDFKPEKVVVEFV